MSKSMWSLVLLGSSLSLLATAAQSQPLGASAECRFTGVGRVIAEQGNAALAALRDQFNQEIKREIQAQLAQRILDLRTAIVLAPTDATVALNVSDVH